MFCFSGKDILFNSGKCKDKKSFKKCKKLKKKKKCNKKKVWKKCMKTCERCPGCPGNQVPNPNNPEECFCPGDLVLDTNNLDQCVCPGNKIPDNTDDSLCICPANQVLDSNNPSQCLCHNGQQPNMTRQCGKFNFFYMTCSLKTDILVEGIITADHSVPFLLLMLPYHSTHGKVEMIAIFHFLDTMISC